MNMGRLSAMGGISSRKVAHDHQLWRPFSCIWLHASVVHLIVDLVSLLFVGTRLEQEFGPCEFADPIHRFFVFYNLATAVPC